LLERIRLLHVGAELELILAVSLCGAAAWVLAHVVGVQKLQPEITTTWSMILPSSSCGVFGIKGNFEVAGGYKNVGA
jgi:hypothetical protein